MASTSLCFSLGYPWLDFLTTDDERAEAGHIASSINEKMEDICAVMTRRGLLLCSAPPFCTNSYHSGSDQHTPIA
jgi:hypothetical protein